MIVVSPWLSELSRLAGVDMRRLARDERADPAAFLTTLSPEQRQAPTLCARWRVRDVVAHVIPQPAFAPPARPRKRRRSKYHP
jgi:hypothetical protein